MEKPAESASPALLFPAYFGSGRRRREKQEM